MNNDHNHLVTLAGRESYVKYRAGAEVEINEITYQVIQVEYNDSSGLDAAAIKNIETGEVTIMYVGTDTGQVQDIKADAMLITPITPEQMKEAQAFYLKVSETENVTNVVGNSLGGGLANYIGVKYEDVNVVTLNPAILPKGVMVEGKSYSNITNYFSKYDFLTSIEIGVGIDDRIPGLRYEINNGTPLKDHFTSTNHTGYVNNRNLLRRGGGEESDEYIDYVELGKEGDRGYVKIYTDAHDHVMTSVWTGETLHGGPTEKLDLSPADLFSLSGIVQDQMTARIERTQEYTGASEEIVQKEKALFSVRQEKLRQAVATAADNAVTAQEFASMITNGVIPRFSIEGALDSVDKLAADLEVFNGVLNSAPVELLEKLTGTTIDTDTLVQPFRDALTGTQEFINDLNASFEDLVVQKVTEVFYSDTYLFSDAIVEELEAHLAIVRANQDTFSQQLAHFKEEVFFTADQMSKTDLEVAQAIGERTRFQSKVGTLMAGKNFTMKDSEYLTAGMEFKQEKAEERYIVLKSAMLPPVTLICLEISKLLVPLAVAADIVKAAVDGSYNIMKMIAKFKFDGDKETFETVLRAAYDRIFSDVYEIEAFVDSLLQEILQLPFNYSDLFEELRPYIDTLLFFDDGYQAIQLYNRASADELGSLMILLNDVEHQLSMQKSAGVEALGHKARQLKSNLSIITEQFERGTVIR